jgi:hypothetical protein
MAEKRKPGRPRKVRTDPLAELDDILGADPIAQTVIPPAPEETRPPPIKLPEGNKEYNEALYELARRRFEALTLYEPLPNQSPFHESRAKERILRGSVRAGKTLPAAVEVARAVCGKDPWWKYPREDGIVYAVLPNEQHIADVIYPKLCWPGAFKIIRDLETGLWRSYRPWQDAARESETKKSAPLIPPRYIKDIAWSNKKAHIPKSIRFTTGWELTFFTEGSIPQRGVAIDLGWFDEEIVSEDWYVEISARLLDRKGKFIWSASPQVGTQMLFEIHKRAEEQLSLPKEQRRAEEYHMKLSVNPFIDKDEVSSLHEKYSADKRRVMIDGEYAIMSYMVYPDFSKTVHGVKEFDIDPSWSHYMLVDPGRQVCGTLFFAVPPDNHALAGRKICYDELYIKDCTASMWGDEVGPRVRGKNFVEFIIDHQGSNPHEIGSGKTVEEQYTEALRVQRVRCRLSGDGFTWGSNDLKAGLSRVHTWLQNRDDGYPTFVYFVERIYWLLWEFERYHNAKKNDQLTDTPLKKNDHLMDLLRYAAMHGLPYVEPPDPGQYKAPLNPFMARWLKREGDQNYIRLG